nr:hypothetical protein [Tanacetum cinerariifolium]
MVMYFSHDLCFYELGYFLLDGFVLVRCMSFPFLPYGWASFVGWIATFIPSAVVGSSGGDSFIAPVTRTAWIFLSLWWPMMSLYGDGDQTTIKFIVMLAECSPSPKDTAKVDPLSTYMQWMKWPSTSVSISIEFSLLSLLASYVKDISWSPTDMLVLTLLLSLASLRHSATFGPRRECMYFFLSPRLLKTFLSLSPSLVNTVVLTGLLRHVGLDLVVVFFTDSPKLIREEEVYGLFQFPMQRSLLCLVESRSDTWSDLHCFDVHNDDYFAHLPLRYADGVILNMCASRMPYEKFVEFVKEKCGNYFQGLYYHVPNIDLERGLVRVGNDRELSYVFDVEETFGRLNSYLDHLDMDLSEYSSQAITNEMDAYVSKIIGPPKKRSSQHPQKPDNGKDATKGVETRTSTTDKGKDATASVEARISTTDKDKEKVSQDATKGVEARTSTVDSDYDSDYYCEFDSDDDSGYHSDKEANAKGKGNLVSEINEPNDENNMPTDNARGETFEEHDTYMNELLTRLKTTDEDEKTEDPFISVEKHVERYPMYDETTHWRLRKPNVGEKCVTVDQFKKCLTYYALANGFSLWYDTSCGKKVSMWLLRHKYHADGSLSMYKAPLVANGHSQQFGVDCDDTFSPVVKPATVHTVLSLALSRNLAIHQLDVKNAFLNGELYETVYMYQPPGYENRVGFSSSRCDSSLFIYQHGSEVAYLLIYVDDIVPTASSMDLLQRIISSLMTDLGALNYFFGIFAIRDSTGMFLSQMKYALDLLDRAHMANCGLQYLTFTRPYISYEVQQLCLHMHDPREPYFAALKRAVYIWLLCFLGDNLLSWSAKRQHTLSRSSAEAEYRGVANVVAETAWLRNLLKKIHTPLLSATLVYCDNVRVLHVPSHYQYADIFRLRFLRNFVLV